MSDQLLLVGEEQVDTHHQQGKENDPTAPDVCFPPVIFLPLRTRASVPCHVTFVQMRSCFRVVEFEAGGARGEL